MSDVTTTSSTVDGDVHIHEKPSDLAPFCEMPWQKSLAEDGSERWLDTAGYSPLTPLDPPTGDYTDQKPYVVEIADQLRADLDRAGIGRAMLYTGRFIGMASSQSVDYATCVCAAYNRYLRERWLDPKRGLYGALLVPTQDPDVAAREIAHNAAAPGIAAVLLSTVHIHPLFGDRIYDPIYAAAVDADLPIVFHGATTYGSIPPYQLQDFQTPLDRGALSMPLGAISNLISMVTNGTFVRFPRLRVLFCEVGLTWLPFVRARLDGQYRFLRANVPDLSKRPSEYIRQQVWVTTHPMADASDPSSTAALIEEIGADRVIFGSDWPHYDHDATSVIEGLPLSATTRAAILGGNANSLFRF